MTWHTRTMALLDFETSGRDPHLDRIVSAAFIHVSGTNGITMKRTWLLNPGIPIPAGAEAVHGISTAQAQAEGTDPAAGVLEIGRLVTTAIRRDIPIVGHNVSTYDLTMLCAELTRYGHADIAQEITTTARAIDTFVIEKSLDRFRPAKYKPNGRRLEKDCGTHQLVDACRLWGVPLSEEDAHGAEADALAAGRLAWKLATNPHRFAEYDASWKPADRIEPGRMTVEELHAWQIDEYARSAKSFESYMRGEQKSKPDEVDPSFVANTVWPIVPLPDGWTPEQMPELEDEETAVPA